MKTRQLSLLLCGLLAAAPGFTYATNHNPAEPCPPNMPRAKSAYSDYVPAHDVSLQSWQEANANAAADSGHAGHSTASGDDMTSKKPDAQNSAKAMPADAASADKSLNTASAGAPIRARGVVQQIDKANSKLKLSHAPIEQLGWPKMAMFMRMKDANVADQIKTGDNVEFELEKSGSSYVVSSISRSGSEPARVSAPTAAPKNLPAAAKKDPAVQAAAPEKAKPATEKPAAPASGSGVSGKGKVLQIDKANAKVKITHEPIEQIGWPKMTMFFKVKEPALLDQIKEGSDIQFTLEKIGSGYVISGFGK